MKKNIFVFILFFGIAGFFQKSYGQALKTKKTTAVSPQVKTKTQVKAQTKLPAAIEKSFNTKYQNHEIREIRTFQRDGKTVYRVFHKTNQGKGDIIWTEFDIAGKIIKTGKAQKEGAAKEHAAE